MKRLFSSRWLCEKFKKIAIDTHCTLAEMIATDYDIDIEACQNRIEEEKARGWLKAQAIFEEWAETVQAEARKKWEQNMEETNND